MERKKDLAKIALAAFILASAAPVNGQAADYGLETEGIYLATGCAESAQGCGGSAATPQSKSSVPNGSSDSNSSQNGSNNNTMRATSDYNDNRAAGTTTAAATLTEAQLLGSLNASGKALYLSLDPEGKALALQLASQDSYQDKNLAVKEAQRRMNERRGLKNR